MNATAHERLAVLEAQVEALQSKEARSAMQLVLEFLKDRRRVLGQEKASVDRAIARIEAELGM